MINPRATLGLGPLLWGLFHTPNQEVAPDSRTYIGPADPYSPAATRSRLARAGSIRGNLGVQRATDFRESGPLAKAEHLANIGLGIAGASINAHRGPGSYQHQLNREVAAAGIRSMVTPAPPAQLTNKITASPADLARQAVSPRQTIDLMVRTPKPAAILGTDATDADIAYAKSLGLHIRAVEYPDAGFTNPDGTVVRQVYAGRTPEALERLLSTRPGDHAAIGRALGYTEQDIADFMSGRLAYYDPPPPPRDAPPPYHSFPGGPSIHASPRRSFGRRQPTPAEMLTHLRGMEQTPTVQRAIRLLEERIDPTPPPFSQLFPMDPTGVGPSSKLPSPPARVGAEVQREGIHEDMPSAPGRGTALIRAGLFEPNIELSEGLPASIRTPTKLDELRQLPPQPNPRARSGVEAFVGRIKRRLEKATDPAERTRIEQMLHEYEFGAVDPWPAWRQLRDKLGEKPPLHEVQARLMGQEPGLPPRPRDRDNPRLTAAIMGHPAFDERLMRRGGRVVQQPDPNVSPINKRPYTRPVTELTETGRPEMYPAGMRVSKAGNQYDPHTKPIQLRDLPDKGQFLDMQSPEAQAFLTPARGLSGDPEYSPRLVNLDTPLSTEDFTAAQRLVSSIPAFQNLLRAKARSFLIKGRVVPSLQASREKIPRQFERDPDAALRGEQPLNRQVLARAFSQGRLPANISARHLLEALNALSPKQHLGTRLMQRLGYDAGHGTQTFGMVGQPPTHRAYLRTFPAPAARTQLPEWVKQAKEQAGIAPDNIMAPFEAQQHRSLIEMDPLYMFAKRHAPELAERMLSGKIGAAEIKDLQLRMLDDVPALRDPTAGVSTLPPEVKTFAMYLEHEPLFARFVDRNAPLGVKFMLKGGFSGERKTDEQTADVIRLAPDLLKLTRDFDKWKYGEE